MKSELKAAERASREMRVGSVETVHVKLLLLVVTTVFVHDLCSVG